MPSAAARLLCDRASGIPYLNAPTSSVIWLSLNNEAIAKAIETALGVTARKAAEKFAWCYAACGGRKGLPARIGAPWEGETTIPFEFRP